MHSAEKRQTTEPDRADLSAQPEAAPDRPRASADVPSETQTPLLGEDQIVKLQKILRSMDYGQLKSVLGALEPNVLRLTLHAIFGRQNSDHTDLSDLTQNQGDSNAGLSAHAKMLAKSKTPDLAQLQSSGDRGASGRLSPRNPTQNNAKIYCPSDETSIDCLILDKSETGALVFLDHAVEVPETFSLYDIGTQRADEEFVHLPHKKCKAVWRKRNKMGVTFVS